MELQVCAKYCWTMHIQLNTNPSSKGESNAKLCSEPPVLLCIYSKLLTLMIAFKNVVCACPAVSHTKTLRVDRVTIEPLLLDVCHQLAQLTRELLVAVYR